MKRYDKSEKRVAWYIWTCVGGMSAAGTDPIGYLIAAHEYLFKEVQRLRTLIPPESDIVSLVKDPTDKQ